MLPYPKYQYTFPVFKTRYQLFIYQAIHLGDLTIYQANALWHICKKSNTNIKLWDFIMQLPREEIPGNVRFYWSLL